MARNFDLASVIPEAMTFTDNAFGGNGQAYVVRPAVQFSPSEHVVLRAMQNDINRVANEPEDGTDRGARIMERRTNEFFAMIVPDMPPERHEAIPYGYKSLFVGWWMKQAEEVNTEGNAERATPTPS